MCCCGNQHDNDPKYKRARCMSGCTMANEIIFCALLFYISIVAALLTIVFCHIAQNPPGNNDSSGIKYKIYKPVSPKQVCTTDLSCGSGKKCKGVCMMSGSNDATKMQWETDIKDKTWNNQGGYMKEFDHTSGKKLCTQNRSSYRTYGYECSGKKLNTSANARYNDLYCSEKICFEKVESRRRLITSVSNNIEEDKKLFSTSMNHMPQFVQDAMNSLVDTMSNLHLDDESSVLSTHGRMLSSITEDQKEIQDAATAACTAGGGIATMFYGGVLFGILGIIFCGIINCACCGPKSCGGYQGQFKAYAIVSAVGAVWQLVPVIMYAVFANSVARIAAVMEKYGHNAGLMRAIETFLLIIMMFAALLIITRGLAAFFAFMASKEPHSTANGGAQQPVVQVQMVGQQNYAQQAYVVQEKPAV